MENAELIATLERFVVDKTATVALYELLPRATFYALVENPKAPVEQLAFLSYDSAEVQELPLFTGPDRPLLGDLQRQSGAAVAQVGGIELWQRLLAITERGVCETAVDPGEPHGIRVPRDMIMGMIATANESE